MATHGNAREVTVNALRTLAPFKRSGFAMVGHDGAVSETGRLAEDYVKLYRNASILYTVTSYATPIAWVTVTGDVIIPDDSYSMTTSHHQSLCRAYLANRG
jgi:hypothetical protein